MPVLPRPDGRRRDELRPIEIAVDFQKHAEGSALIKAGDTWVLCAASVEERVPPFITDLGSGWVTAEYAMLPRSTHTRTDRSGGGRAKEIQRLIGRALRASVDLSRLGRRTITIDCDVLSADGGTRCASITGAYVALALALRWLETHGLIASAASVLGEPVAAVSVGVVGGESRLDLVYAEDSAAEVDMNLVMTASGRLIEIQGTAERASFSRAQLDELVELAGAGIARLCEIQRDLLSRATR
jgi:ribonuclease PH